MDNTLIIKITLTDNKVLLFEKEVHEVREFVDGVSEEGLYDGSTFYPSEAVDTIEVFPPDDPSEDPFSVN